MTHLTRRSMLTGLAATAATPLLARAAPQTSTPQRIATLMAYFKTTVPQLLRPAEGILQHPSIAIALPGKEYSTSLWDWDTLWTARGLFRYANLTSNSALHTQIVEHSQGSLLNFLDHQTADGRLPILLTTTDADPLGAVIKDDAARNQAKPIFAQLALLIADNASNVAWLAPHFDKLLHFYQSWMRKNLTPLGLFVWGNDIAIGDDNDPTTFGRPPFSSANILLNCFFYSEFRAAAELAQRLHRSADADSLSRQASSLGAAIQKHCWDSRDHFFYTVDVQCVDRRAELIPKISRGMAMSWSSLPLRIQMFTGFLPMTFGLATPQQARQMIETNYKRDDRFSAASGIRSLSRLESMYSLDFSSNPSNWLGPTWILVNFLVWKGFKNYGFQQEADELAAKTLRLLSDDIATSGSMNEYYHPDTGAPLSHKGFMDWNLLVLEMI